MKKELRQGDDVSASHCFRLQSACSGFLPACLPAIHLSIHLSSLSLFRSTIFRLLERHFYFMPCETFKCQVEEGAGGRGHASGGMHDATACLLMHTCGLVLSPFYILDENMRKLPFACVSILEIVNHMLLLPSHPHCHAPPPILMSWLQKAAGNKALATRIICLSSASRK